MYKAWDGVMKGALENEDEEHQLIEECQGGFKRKEGTLEQLYVLQNIFMYNRNVHCAFLDLEKAYVDDAMPNGFLGLNPQSVKDYVEEGAPWTEEEFVDYVSFFDDVCFYLSVFVCLFTRTHRSLTHTHITHTYSHHFTRWIAMVMD